MDFQFCKCTHKYIKLIHFQRKRKMIWIINFTSISSKVYRHTDGPIELNSRCSEVRIFFLNKIHFSIMNRSKVNIIYSLTVKFSYSMTLDRYKTFKTNLNQKALNCIYLEKFFLMKYQFLLYFVFCIKCLFPPFSYI